MPLFVHSCGKDSLISFCRDKLQTLSSPVITMGTPDFRFRQFTIRHDRCAMKVGTDGVLLGAWAAVPPSGTVLDIGTGTGLIALMVAQRAPQAHVVGIDIDAAAVLQAKENVAASPFSSRVSIRQAELSVYAASFTERYAAIVCNPPFFTESLLPPNQARSAARHEQSLPFPTLVSCASQLLQDDGSFNVILPSSALGDFRSEAFAHDLVLTRLCHVRTTPSKPPKRILGTFVKAPSTPFRFEEDTLVLMEGGTRSADYTSLTSEFYL